MLNLITYGENSIQTFRSYINIGICYNRTNRQNSAIRNFEKPRQLQGICSPSPLEVIVLAVETTEAYLMLFSEAYIKQKDSEGLKQLKAATTVIEPYKNVVINNPEIMYRKSLAFAPILSIKKKHKESMPFFKSGIDSNKDAFLKPNDGLPRLYVQAAANAEALGDSDEIAVETKFDNYQNAYDLFIELKMDKEAEAIKTKLRKEEYQNRKKENVAHAIEPEKDMRFCQTQDEKPGQYIGPHCDDQTIEGKTAKQEQEQEQIAQIKPKKDE